MTTFTPALVGLFLLSATSTVSAGHPALYGVGEAPLPQYTVAMTGYNAVPGQTDDNPLVTAAGVFSDPDVVAARSQDLADDLPFGTVIEIVPESATSSPTCGLPNVMDKVGYRVIADTMNARMHNKIDILFHASQSVNGKKVNPARILGKCKGIDIRVVGHVDITHMPKDQAELKEMLAETSPKTLAFNSR